MIKEIEAKHDDEKRRTQINFDDYKRKVGGLLNRKINFF